MVYLFYKIVKGRKYYYLGENKSINGQSRRILEIYLGSADNLMSYMQQSSLPKEIESISYGLPASLLNINEDINFVKIIDKHCSKREQGLSVGEHILIDLINRIDDPVSHNKLGDWFSKTLLRKIFKVKPAYLSSQGYWNHWQYFDEGEGKWVSRDRLSFEVTGGSKTGYRGYSFKGNASTGKWRVDVETARGQVLGRILFRVLPIEEGAPELKTVVK